MNKIQELSLEQLHYDLEQVQAQLKSLPELIGKHMPEIIPANVDVTVLDPEKSFDGNVVVTNDIQVGNIKELSDRLDTLITKVETHGYVQPESTHKELAEISNVLAKILAKDTSVNVESPVVKVASPDNIKLNNWPSSPDKPVAVRLSDGKRFINEMTRIVSGGGSSVPTKLIHSLDALKVLDIPLATKVVTVGSITYIAKAAPGTQQSAASWQVHKVDETSGTVITWADGDGEYDNVATDLEALSYS